MARLITITKPIIKEKIMKQNNLNINNRQLQALYRQDLSSFIQMAFKTLEPYSQYHHSPHIDLIADYLMQTYHGDKNNLIINMPPSMMKSLSVSVAYAAWILGKAPQTKIMCVSYSEDLARDLSMKTQKLMNAEFYKLLFPETIINSNRLTQLECFASVGGGRYAVSTGGAIAGFGVDIIIIDDPIKPTDANSKRLENCNRWFTENIYQRLNNKNTGSIIVVMQRVHENDLTGFLLSKQINWQHLSIPAIAETDEYYKLKSGDVYTRKLGQALHPQRESLKQLKQVKHNLSSTIFTVQYQQRPAPAQGSIIKAKWFMRHHETQYPQERYLKIIVQSWDTAISEKDSADYSVGITFAFYKVHGVYRYYILDVIRKKMEFPKLLQTIKKARNKYYYVYPTHVVVEDIGVGKAVIQALEEQDIEIESHKPTGDKYTRLVTTTDVLETGQIYLPKQAPWLDDFIQELTHFPNAKHDDQVDAFSQGLNYLRDIYKNRIIMVDLAGF